MPRGIVRLIGGGLVAVLAAAGCTQGLSIEEGERAPRSVSTIDFLFAEGQREFAIPTAAPAPLAGSAGAATGPMPAAADAQAEQPSPSPTATSPAPAPTAATPGDASEPTPAPTPAIDTSAIVANRVASSIAVPHAVVDSDLQIVFLSPDPADETVLPSEMLSAANLESYLLSVASRQPESAALTERSRPVQLTQRVFVHEDAASAESFYAFLSDEVVPRLAFFTVSQFREFYPDLTSSLGSFDGAEVGEETLLALLEIDPQIAEGEQIDGPGVPALYYLSVREGRVTALMEVAFIAPQDPRAIAEIGALMIERIPQELRPAAVP